ncbi:MAG: DUF1850 domain-containing protein [Bacillota bacterium]
MSTSSKVRKRWRWAAVLVAVALLFLPVDVLSVRRSRGSGLVWAVRAGPGQSFTLRWTHTVTLRPVEERYEILEGRLHLRRMVFDQYGPNLPAGPEEGTVWRVEGDRWVVTGYRIAVEQLHLGLSHIDHRLVVGDRELDLLRAAGPNALVRLQAERLPLIMIIWTEVRQWRTSKPLP